MCQIKPLRKLASMLLTTAFVMGTFITIAVASGRLEFKKVKKIAADTGAGVKDAAKDVAVATKDIATDVAVATKDTVGETAVQVGNKIQVRSPRTWRSVAKRVAALVWCWVLPAPVEDELRAASADNDTG